MGLVPTPIKSTGSSFKNVAKLDFFTKCGCNFYMNSHESQVRWYKLFGAFSNEHPVVGLNMFDNSIAE